MTTKIDKKWWNGQKLTKTTKMTTENDKNWQNDIIWHEWQNGEIHQKIAKLVNQEQQLINF